MECSASLFSTHIGAQRKEGFFGFSPSLQQGEQEREEKKNRDNALEPAGVAVVLLVKVKILGVRQIVALLVHAVQKGHGIVQDGPGGGVLHKVQLTETTKNSQSAVEWTGDGAKKKEEKHDDKTSSSLQEVREVDVVGNRFLNHVR